MSDNETTNNPTANAGSIDVGAAAGAPITIGASAPSSAAPAAAEEENVFLFYTDEEGNSGPGQFVMHGPNLFFSRGTLTGPVTTTVAGIVTGRKKPPVIRVASADEIKALQPKEEKVADAAAAEKSGGDDGANTTSTSSDGKSASTGSGTTGPADTKPGASPATERKPKSGTKLTTG